LASSEYGLGEHQSHSVGVFRVWLRGSKVAIEIRVKGLFSKAIERVGGSSEQQGLGSRILGLGLIHT
jgi:hypothetical protein